MAGHFSQYTLHAPKMASSLSFSLPRREKGKKEERREKRNRTSSPAGRKRFRLIGERESRLHRRRCNRHEIPIIRDETQIEFSSAAGGKRRLESRARRGMIKLRMRASAAPGVSVSRIASERRRRRRRRWWFCVYFFTLASVLLACARVYMCCSSVV